MNYGLEVLPALVAVRNVDEIIARGARLHRAALSALAPPWPPLDVLEYRWQLLRWAGLDGWERPEEVESMIAGIVAE